MSWGLNRHVSRATSHCREERNRKRKTEKHWAMADPNDRKTADHYRKLDLGADWRSADAVLCAYGYFYWGWCVTCNSHVRRKSNVAHVTAGSPWVDFGALQDWLLAPTRSVTKRVEAILGRHGTCDVGVHLRRADDGDKKAAATFNPKWVAQVEALLEGTSGLALFIAADRESAKTRQKLVEVAAKRGAAVLVDPAPATRDTESGIYAALAENYVLSSCAHILPRGTGASTFHDMAVGRAAFEQNWDDAAVAAFAKRTKDKPARPLIAPALCADLRNESAPPDKPPDPWDSSHAARPWA